VFIRETTSIDNHAYRFARRAWQEGMWSSTPDLDDPLHQQGVPDGAAGAEPGGDPADRDHCRTPTSPRRWTKSPESPDEECATHGNYVRSTRIN
jgi:hypothetical protein